VPSLHLDIPSIDWGARPGRAGGPGRGKARPLQGGQADTPPSEPVRRPASKEAPKLEPWPGKLAGVVA